MCVCVVIYMCVVMSSMCGTSIIEEACCGTTVVEFTHIADLDYVCVCVW